MSMPRAIRHINEIRVLDTVFKHQKISRAGIARDLGMTRSTASSIVAALMDEGLVIEDNSEEDKAAGTGRPGTFVRLNAYQALFIGADIGIGRLRVVALDLEANIVVQEHLDVPQGTTKVEEILDRLAELINRLSANVAGKYVIHGACLTVPGLVDRSGRVFRAPLLDWKTLPVLDQLNERLERTQVLAVENDANAFAIAEMYRSKGGDGTEIYMYLDAGVGGAIFNGGQLLRGRDGHAGEFGHIILGDEGFVELATVPGSLESYIGREAILARYRFHGGSADELRPFFDAIERGEKAALATLRDWASYLGRGLATLISVFNPSRIVLGGPVASLYKYCMEDIHNAVAKNLLGDQPLPSLSLSELGQEGPALGAACMLHRRMLSVDQDLVYQGAPVASRMAENISSDS